MLNIKSRTIFNKDNIEILKNINSNSIDVIYLDPPFNKKKKFIAPTGSSATGAEFSDIFKEEDIKDEWIRIIEGIHTELYEFLITIKKFKEKNNYNYCYLVYMAIRLIECHRILKDTGNLFLHCDATMGHYLKIVLDCIFKEENFKNEIIWHYHTSGNAKHWYVKNHDIILYYTKSKNNYFNMLKDKRYTKAKSRKMGIQNLGKGEKEFFEDEKGVYQFTNMEDVWNIPYINSQAKERTGYPTQKPLELLERIIKSSCPQDGIVLDPFCGCATTCIASEKLDRKWVGIDISFKAYELVKKRLANEVPTDIFRKDPIFTTESPVRTDTIQDNLPLGNVYIISHRNYKKEYKVGIAKNVKSRFSSYQTADPDRNFALEYQKATPYFIEIEKFIHNKYPNKYEWVQGNIEDIINDIENFTPEQAGIIF